MATAGEGQPVATGDQPFSAADLVEGLLHLQAQRIATYDEFETGFAQHDAGTADFEAYRKVAHAVTRKFQLLSEDATDLKRRCGELGRDDLVSAIVEIQELEEEKLKLTAEYQLVRSTSGAGGATEEPVRAAKRSLNQVSQALADKSRELRLELD